VTDLMMAMEVNIVKIGPHNTTERNNAGDSSHPHSSVQEFACLINGNWHCLRVRSHQIPRTSADFPQGGKRHVQRFLENEGSDRNTPACSLTASSRACSCPDFCLWATLTNRPRLSSRKYSTDGSQYSRYTFKYRESACFRRDEKLAGRAVCLIRVTYRSRVVTSGLILCRHCREPGEVHWTSRGVARLRRNR
jgi:hypothetical protein